MCLPLPQLSASTTQPGSLPAPCLPTCLLACLRAAGVPAHHASQLAPPALPRLPWPLTTAPFCPPPCPLQSDRLKRCYDSLLPTKLRRMLVSDCRAFVGCRHADVDRRGIEAYLTRVLHPMLARR